MKNIKYILLLTTLLTMGSFATDLPSRAFLGVSGSSNDQGAIIDQVIPGGTGDSMKIQQGDIITSINGAEVDGFPQLVEKLGHLKVGETIQVKVLREDKIKTLSGDIKSRPREKAADNSSFRIIYDTVKYKDNSLRSIVYRPIKANSENKFPAVFFVQGYTCSSIDYGLVPQASSHQLLMSLAEAGYVVYKIEKFGMGDSQGSLRCQDVDFSTELAGFNAGIDALKSYDFVDSNEVHLFGHSLGGVYAPFVAQHTKIKSLISYGAVVDSWYDYLLDIYSEQAQLFGTSEAEGNRNRKTVKPLLKAWLKSQRSWDEILADKELKVALDSNLVPISGEQVFHRHYSFFRDLNRYDLSKAWRTTGSHVLAIHGSLDIQAISDKWATQMSSLPENKNLKTQKVVLDGAEHAFMRYDSLSDYLAARNTRSYRPGQPGDAYDPRVAETIIEWLRSFGNG